MEKYRKKDIISDKELSEFEHIEIEKIKTMISNIETSKINWRKYMPTLLPVSLLTTLIIVITIVISGNLSQTPIEVDNTVIDVGEDGINGYLDGTEGCTGVDGVSVRMFFSFEEMLNCDYCGFVQGRVISISNYNIFVDKVYLEVILSEFSDESEIINISVESGSRSMDVGGMYILNLIYTESHDYYSLSQVNDGIFSLVSNTVIIPDGFVNDDIPTELQEFLKYVSLSD